MSDRPQAGDSFCCLHPYKGQQGLTRMVQMMEKAEGADWGQSFFLTLFSYSRREQVQRPHLSVANREGRMGVSSRKRDKSLV